MLQLFGTVFGQVMILFIMIGIGFLFGKLGKVNMDGASQITLFLLYVINPCCLLDAMVNGYTEGMLGEFLLLILLTLLIHLLFIGLMQLFFRGRDQVSSAVFRSAAIYGNMGFMGIPLIGMVLGDTAVAYLSIVIVTQNLLLWSHCAGTISGQMNLRKVFVNPMVPCFLIGLLLIMTGWRFPLPIMRTITLLGNANSSMAMLVIGVQMAHVPVGGLFRNPDYYLVTFLKLVGTPLLALALLLVLPLHLPKLIICTFVIAFSTPMAGSVSMFAQNYGNGVEKTSQLAFLTMLFSILTMPVIGTLVQMLP